MKLFFKILILSFLFHQLNAQCIVDAGDDRVICLDVNTSFVDTPSLLASVSNVVEPYQVVWTTTIETNLTTLPYIYASDMLSDTSVLNPLLYTHIYAKNNVPINFAIQITDSVGNTCKDSLKIRFSTFAITIKDIKIYQEAGDTALISASVSGGIPPIRYSWFPKENIDTITNNSCCPFVWPSSEVTYSAMAIDSAGCTVGTNPTWHFTIISSIINLTNNELKIYPNPTQGILNFDLKEDIENLSIKIIDAKGKIVLAKSIESHWIDLSNLAKGIYTFQLFGEKDKLLSYGKVQKE